MSSCSTRHVMCSVMETSRAQRGWGWGGDVWLGMGASEVAGDGEDLVRGRGGVIGAKAAGCQACSVEVWRGLARWCVVSGEL
jgi:hypothetical protein